MKSPLATIIRIFLFLALFILPGLSSPVAAQEEPPAATGSLQFGVYRCGPEDGITESFLQFPPRTDLLPCQPEAGVFSIYTYGDGSADYQAVDTSVTPAIDLPVGSYQVVDETTQLKLDVTIGEGDVITVLAAHVVDTQPTGRLTLTGWACTDATSNAIYGSDPWMGSTLPDGPTSDCTVFTPNWTVYDEYRFENRAVDGTTLVLPVGLYTVTDQDTGLSAAMYVSEGQETVVLSVHASEPQEPTYELNMTSYQCNQFEKDFIQNSSFVSMNELSRCTQVSTIFGVYQNGTQVSGLENSANQSLFLPAGTYTVVDETTGLQTDVVVGPEKVGIVISIHTNQDDVVAKPTAPAPAPTATAPAKVTALPSTGGQPENESSLLPMVMMLGVVSLLGTGLIAGRKG